MKKKFSITFKTIIALVAFALFVLGLIYVFQTFYLEDFYIKNKVKLLENTTNEIAVQIESDELDTMVETYSLSNEVCVRIVSDEVSIMGNVRNGMCALNRLDDNMIVQLKNEVDSEGGEKLINNYKFMMPESKEPMDIFIYGKTVSVNASDVLILVSTMVTPLNATVGTLQAQYMFIATIVIIATIVLGIVFSKVVFRPVKEISSKVKDLPQGNYSGEIIKTSTREFRELNENLKEANEQIKKADRLKKELLANVSHDLRTPLTMIVGYGEMIRDIETENTKENINVIIDEAKRLSTLVNDLIDLSKMEADEISLNKEQVNVNDMLKSVYNQYKKYCDQKDVEFVLDLKDDFKAEMDEKRITQVIYNFINNALNYNDKSEKKIVLGTEKLEKIYRIYVYDNGSGIKEEDKEQIWERYYKVDKEHKRFQVGSGIGLAISKDILVKHGFSYGVESEPGEYSKFYFEIEAN